MRVEHQLIRDVFTTLSSIYDGLYTAQKLKFSIKEKGVSINLNIQIHSCVIKDFFSKCDQIRRLMRIWSNILKKSLMENFIFCAVLCENS